MSPGHTSAAGSTGSPVGGPAARLRRRAGFALALLILGFAVVAVQVVRLGLSGGARLRIAALEAPPSGWARPDIVDRHGRLMATDRAVSSLYADPQLVQEADQVAARLAAALPGVDGAELRRALADRGRRFVWVARGLAPAEAQAIQGLGLPGLGFRAELKRYYPLGPLAGHLLGAVNVDNRGLAGIERMLDESGLIDPSRDGERSTRPAVRLALDIGVEHAVAEELRRALQQFGASAGAALVLDVRTGEIVAAVSLPAIDPNRPGALLDPARIDRLTAGTFELGSVYKILTIALALECGIADLDSIVDVRRPLRAGSHLIRDHYPQGRPLTVREVFLFSSNVGAGMLALQVGSERQRAFLAKLGLLEPMRTEAGPVAPPQLPSNWGRAETITIAYGHGLAVAPLQFAAAAAAVINGGVKLVPTFLMRADPSNEPSSEPRSGPPSEPAGEPRSETPNGPASEAASGSRNEPENEPQRESRGAGRVVTAATSAAMRELMRLGVTHASGTGRRAEAEGYGVGGKTGTAEMPGRGGYREKSVIASFLGAFPMQAPRYVTLVTLFEPQGTSETKGRITAAVNAAPATARIVERIAPLLGVMPRMVEAHPAARGSAPFDAPHEAQ